MLGHEPIGLSPLATEWQEVYFTIAESLAFTNTVDGQYWLPVVERLSLAEVLTPTQRLLIAINEVLALDDDLRVTLAASVSETVDFSQTIVSDRLFAASIIDSMVLAGTETNTLKAIAALVEILALADAMTLVQQLTVADAMAFVNTITNQTGWYEAILTNAVFGETLSAAMRVTIQVSDSVALASATTATAALIAAINEGLEFALGFTLGDLAYIGYSMNAATKSLTKYTNFNFNSLASFGGTTYAAGAAGLYKLGGANDAGSAIIWKIRTGLSDLGSRHHKGLDAAYLGYTADGRIAFKCIVVTPSGEKSVYWYELTAQTANVARPGRIPTGRGLRSVYWGFEMTNVDAGDIALDVLELHPIIFEGRLP